MTQRQLRDEDDLGFHLLMSTLNCYNDKIRNLEHDRDKLYTTCRILNEVAESQRQRISELEKQLFTYDDSLR